MIPRVPPPEPEMPKMRTFRTIEREYAVHVTITIASDAPANLFTRMVDEPEYYLNLYGPLEVDQILDLWSYNAAVNHVEDAISLDGWADLMPGVVTFTVDAA